MIRFTRLAVLTATLLSFATPIVAQQDERRSNANSCAAKAAGSYGFQCHGSQFSRTVFEPVTFIGTVKGTKDGFYEGYGTFNSSDGSVTIHVAGQASFGPSCFGHIDYTTNEILLPDGGTTALPTLSIDFIAVDNEILGMPVAPPGGTGDLVPRVTCRLVRTDRKGSRK
jgi:hypothetical protein